MVVPEEPTADGMEVHLREPVAILPVAVVAVELLVLVLIVHFFHLVIHAEA
jgi:hypothetical protein